MNFDIMLDLETLDVKPGAVILSIGAVAFGLTDEGKTLVSPDCFYERLDIDEQLAKGGTVSGNTLQWWFQQSDKARMAATASPNGAKFVLGRFNNWYLKFVRLTGHRPKIWGHGATFDLPILEAAMHRHDVQPVWDFRAGRDTRTLFDIAGKKMGDFGTVNQNEHDSLADALFQCDETGKCIKYINDQMLHGRISKPGRQL